MHTNETAARTGVACMELLGHMISKQTAYDIWVAYDEIEKGNALAAKMESARKEGEQFNLRDTFGRPRGLQLGVPTSENGHRLFDVAPALALTVIQAHVAGKVSELKALNEKARAELS
jgi:hypothetical protein